MYNFIDIIDQKNIWICPKKVIFSFHLVVKHADTTNGTIKVTRHGLINRWMVRVGLLSCRLRPSSTRFDLIYSTRQRLTASCATCLVRANGLSRKRLPPGPRANVSGSVLLVLSSSPFLDRAAEAGELTRARSSTADGRVGGDRLRWRPRSCCCGGDHGLRSFNVDPHPAPPLRSCCLSRFMFCLYAK